MEHAWNADPAASFAHRMGKSPSELGITRDNVDCPDMWQLDNGDVAVIGRDLTAAYSSRLPADVHIAADERLVIIPLKLLIAAKGGIPDV